MGVDDDRRLTAAERRLQIIGAVERLANPDDLTMARWREILSGTGAIITDGDVDGLVSSIMLGAVSDYRVKCILINGRAHLHPEVADLRSLLADDSTIGLDVMLATRPSISNHVLHIGAYTSPPWLLEATTERDASVDRILDECAAINFSGWCGISARHKTNLATSAAYRYPLGTAQVVLAVLELLDRPPRFYDRRFMPWMVANADGGVTSIRDYPWNVDVWWSSMAAAVGPASMSESLYRLVSEQRPSSFRDADRALRHETRGSDTADGAADCLDERWNVSPENVEATMAATRLLQSLSGWPDPFHGGVDSLPTW